jgi:hypothetical protein
MMSAQDGKRLSSRLRPAISRTADKVRRQIARVDNPEVRNARTLARLSRTSSVDILALGDSMVSWTAPYDSDARPFHRMLKDSFGPEATTLAVHGGSYNPPLYNQYVRMLEGHSAPPLVILPLTPRVRTLPWIEHPAHGHQRASHFLSTVDATTPLRRIRKGFTPPTPSDFEQFYALKFSTWAGDLTIGDYVRPLKRNELSEDESARLLYAYHHGGEIEPGAPLDMVRELGDRLRRLGASVVVYQTPVPVEKGVELHGQQFYELAERNFAVLEDAFVSGYGDVPVVRTGLTAPTTHFIDWRDGSEHLNELGRSVVASAVVDATRAHGLYPPFRKTTSM